jgi:hypothetical protein
LVEAINTAPALLSVMNAKLIGGSRSSLVMADLTQNTFGPIRLNGTQDVIVQPGEALVGAGILSNQVTLRFANELPDDDYRIDVFGFDDPVRNILGLRNVSGELFVSSSATSRQDTYRMRLELGSRVEAVVPQPVIRLASGQLEQRRNEIVVYFNDDNLFVENDATGNPTPRSAENPQFYSLILTNESANNRDDEFVVPNRVTYNPGADTATLDFGTDLSNLFGGRAGRDTLRLRVGTAETTPIAPQPVNISGRIGTAALAAGASISLETKVEGRELSVAFVSASSNSIAVVGNLVTVSLATGSTLQDVVNLIERDAVASSLLAVTVNGLSSTPVVNFPPEPTKLLEVGGTFDTASSLGVFASANPLGGTVYSQRISNEISPSFSPIELPGSNEDPGHRRFPSPSSRTFDQHINVDFGPDVVAGVTTIPYNFKSNYVVGRVNAINDQQKNRIREGLDLWGSKLGIQFVETPNQGLTFARGDVNAIPFSPTRYLRPDLNFGVLIDSRISDVGFNANNSNGLLVLDSLLAWNDRYAEDFFRTAMAGIGFLLGLEGAADLPANTIMSLTDEFLSPTFQRTTGVLPTYITNVGPQRLEPVFPGNADVIHGRHVFRPEGNDIDLYRFEVALGDPTKLGELSVETFAERLPLSSLLDTHVTLYRQVQASLETDFGLNKGVTLRLEAKGQGLTGNRVSLQFLVTPTGGAAPQVLIDPATPNAIAILSSDPSQVSFQAVADAINSHPLANKLVSVTLLHGGQIDPALVFLSGIAEEGSPQLLTGGRIESIARNDNYYSKDSFLRAELSNGVYYIGVSSKGNDVINPVIENSGDGGTTQGRYELLVKFRPQVDDASVLRDLDGNSLDSPSTFRFPGTRFDGDADGNVGGVHNFWFQTRPLRRQLVISAGDRFVDGQVLTITDARGTVRRFEFSTDGIAGPNRIAVPFGPLDSAVTLATALEFAIRNSGLQITVDFAANVLTLNGERSVALSTNVTGIELVGRTIFVDKDPSAGPQAEGTLSRPFNNIAGGGVPNAFGAALAGDIVRIVGNAGADRNFDTLTDNLSYQIGFGSLAGQLLEDGTRMEVPRGVTVMIDAGAIFKLRRSYIGVGSTSTTEDRSESALQVLGTPRLLDNSGRVLRQLSGAAVPGSVYFTSALDEAVGRDISTISTVPEPGNWGGILFNRALDRQLGRPDLEDEGIFIQHVGFADMRYGGGKDISIDGNAQVVNPIAIVDRRPTVVHNTITQSADAAISASPDSFEETNFQSPRFQASVSFTSDYDRVGPDIYRNQLTDNSINGLFVRSVTPFAGTLRELNVSGRFDDIDVVHYLAENLVISGTPGGSLVDRTIAPVTLVTGRALTGGTLAPATYRYRVSYVDPFGNESLPSDLTTGITTSASQGTIELASLPPAVSPYVGRRLYRSRTDGTFDLVAELDTSSSRFLDTGFRKNLGNTGIALNNNVEVHLHRPDASLVFDPGIVTKLEGVRIEIEFGAQLLAEGLPELPIIFTSKLDDRFGIGGTLDTNNDRGALVPAPGNWGGIYVAPNAQLSLDHTILAFAGGLTRIEGTFRSFNPIELQQGSARITNSTFQDNADGQGGQGPVERFGRLANAPATIFSRGSQPILVGNRFLGNEGSILDIDIGAFSAEVLVDVGRQTGNLSRITGFEDNYGPLIRLNRLDDNDLNGIEIRGAEVTTETVLDDTDIVHVFYDEISTGNLHSSSGIRLQSRPDQSLVVKFAGTLERPDGRQVGSGSPYEERFGTGITAFGELSNTPDRIGGTVHIIGYPGSPVVLTSLADDSVGAGTRPDGRPQTDTNNDLWGSRARPNDWRGILLDQFSNDRNVDYVLESEPANLSSQGNNATTETAQLLGALAGRPTASDEALRLGFVVQGTLSNPADLDVYSFLGEAGTEVWLDVDRTTHYLDTIVELLDVDGNVLVRSTSSMAEAAGATIEVFDIDPEQVGPLQRTADLLTNFNVNGEYQDFGSTNVRDAGFRVTLPGTRGARSIYHVRVRSQGSSIDDFTGGLTSGGYALQVRMQEAQEYPGSIVRHADIRYSLHGVHLRGLPYHSPLLGEAQENEGVDSLFSAFTNNSVYTDESAPGNRAQFVGNILESDRLAISVGGNLEGFFGSDVDFYQFDVDHANQSGLAFPAVIDLDYADDLGRPNLNISVYYDRDGETGPALPTLVLFSQDSNIADDRSSPLGGALDEDLLRGSIGDGDPFLGPQVLPEGTYYVAISERSRIPTPLTQIEARREPIPSIERIVEDHFEFTGGSTFKPPRIPQFISRDNLPNGWEISATQSAVGGHGVYNAFDGSRIGGAISAFNGAVQQEIDTDVVSLISNNTIRAVSAFGNAQDLDAQAPVWSLGFNANISNSNSIPHTTVSNALLGTSQQDRLFFNREIDVVDLYQVNHAGGQLIVEFDPQSSLGFGQVTAQLILLQGSAIIAGPSGFTTLSQNLGAGVYTIGVMPPGTTYDPMTGRFERPNVLLNTNTPVDYNTGRYDLHVSSEGHPVAANSQGNASLNFAPDATFVGVGQVESIAFSLEGYTAEDLPMLYFNYRLDFDADDSVSIRVVSDTNPLGTLIASNMGFNPQLTDTVGFGVPSSFRQARIPLSAVAGQSGLRLQFTYNLNGTFSNASSWSMDDFIIGFAERGELITEAAAGDDSFTTIGGSFGAVANGTYQFEVREGTSYATTSNGVTTQFASFDTNLRQGPSVTFLVPQGNQLRDGDFFQLGDGSRSLTFEFDSNGSVQLGRIRVPFDSTSSQAQVSSAIIQAINSPQVQAVLSIQAATPGGSANGVGNQGSPRINIFGNVTGDFLAQQESFLEIQPGGTALALAQTLAGDDVLVSNAVLTGATFPNPVSHGRFSNGRGLLGADSGIVLSTGAVSSALGPNTDSATGGTAAGVGNSAINTSFGVTTSDHIALEFDVTIPANATNLFLQMVFASEEYPEDLTILENDIAAVFVNGNAVPTGTNAFNGIAGSEISANVYSSTSADVTVSDPQSGGDFLAELGYDGFTVPLTAVATGLAPGGTHRVRIIVADNGPNQRDSALFLASGSLTTVVPRDPRRAADDLGRVQFPAIVSAGTGDSNSRREQGQIIVQNNHFTEIAAYGVWSEAGDRQRDPEDARSLFGQSQLLSQVGLSSGHPFLEHPNLGNSGIGAVQNLRTLNDSVVGGLAPGAYIANNIFDNAQAAAIQLEGETRPWQITAASLFDTEILSSVGDNGTHFGDFIPDGLTITVDVGHTRVVFEFEELNGEARGGASVIVGCGSGVAGGNGVAPGHVPIYYRKDGGSNYNGRPATGTGYGYNEMEVMHSIRDSVLGSILVTNGIVELVDPVVGPSLFARSNDNFYSFFDTGMGFSHPALYLYKAASVTFSTEFTDGGPCNTSPFLTSQAEIHEGVQPFAKVVNNTIYGTDGNLNLSPAGVSEPNDTVENAVDTRLGRGSNPSTFTTNGFIGDGPLFNARDVDFYQFSLDVGDRARIDVNTQRVASPVDTTLRLFNSRGEEILLNQTGNSRQDVTVVTNAITAADTFVDVASTAGFANRGTLLIGNERINYTGLTGTSFTGLTRGVGGTVASPHGPNSTVVQFPRIDPFLDFTATEKDVYYIGVSADGNEVYDPFSLADRSVGVASGDYSISFEVLAPRSFVLTPTDNIGGFITITQIADIPGQPGNQVTLNLNNVQGDRPWDMASGLADLINAAADPGLGGLLFNHERRNGPAGLSGPITRVEAGALGGIDADKADIGIRERSVIDGEQVGINLAVGGVPDNIYDTTIVFPRTPLSGFNYSDNYVLFRRHVAGGNASDFNEGGFGHVRGHAGINTANDGAAELHVWVRNAADIDISGATGLRLDPLPGQNADQVIPQTGIMVLGGASPTLLNNTIVNTHGGVVQEVTRQAGFGVPGDFLSLFRGDNLHSKPGEVIVGGSLFQGVSNDVPSFRQVRIRNNTGVFGDAGFELGPSNVNAAQDDFNFTIDPTIRLLSNPEGGDFKPAPGSPAIDSSIDSLLEREEYNAFKRAVGIAPSPIFAPVIDVFGQFRSDDPDVSSPSGIGGDVFKDRGAVERADFTGPVADLTNPLVNDAAGRDQDSSRTIVRLASGTSREFRIRLQDIGDAADPFNGIGVDGTSILGLETALRLPGAAVTLFENERLLTEGLDYVYSVDTTTNEIVLTPVAGIFQPDAVYRIQLNHRDRFVVEAPAGPQASDGSVLTVTDPGGGRVLLEFESGHQIRLPTDLTIRVPEAGGSIGGVQDGDRITLALPTGGELVFEFDNNNSLVTTGAIRVVFRVVDTRDQITSALHQALLANAVGVGKPLSSATIVTDSTNAPTGSILLVPTNDLTGQGLAGVNVGVGASAFSLPAGALAISVLPSFNVGDGESFTISDGRLTRRFELDTDGNVTIGSIPVDMTNINSSDALAQEILNALGISGLSANPSIIAGRIVYLGLPEGSTVVANGPGLRAVGVTRPVRDGNGFAFGLSSTITGRSLTNNVATLRFDTAHHFSAGQSVVVTGIDTIFDGTYIISSVTPTTLSYSRINGNIPFAVVNNTASAATVSVRVEFDNNNQFPTNAIRVPLAAGASNQQLASNLENALLNNGLLTAYDVQPKAFGTLVSLFGSRDVSLRLDPSAPLESLGRPGVQGGTALVIAGPLLMRVPPVGGVSITDGTTFTITNNGLTVTFEMDVDGALLNPTATAVRYSFADTAAGVAASIATAITSTGLNLTAVAQGSAVNLGNLPSSSVTVSNTLPITVGPGTVSDGQRVTLRNGPLSTTFEFESTTNGGGVTLGNTQVLFDPNGSAADVAISLTASINGSGLGITATIDPLMRNRIVLEDTPQTRIDVSFAPTVQVTGVPGGAIPVRVVNAPEFTAVDVKNALIAAINLENQRRANGITASDRGGNTFFLEGAQSLGDELPSYFLRAIEDELGNPLKPNQPNNTVQFAILQPNVTFDFGDSPDPVGQTAGRYPVRVVNEGARHVITLGVDGNPVGPRLGAFIDADVDGQPSTDAEGDDMSIIANVAAAPSGRQVFQVVSSSLGADITVALPTTLVEAEGATLTIQLGTRTEIFEIDSDGQFNERHRRVQLAGTANQQALNLRDVIASSSLKVAGLQVVGGTLTLIADDEDGVVLGVANSPGTVLTPGGTIQGTVDVRGPGFLSGWVDLNFDGDWNDPGEQIFTDLSVASGNNIVPFNIRLPADAATPVDPLGASTFARFRVATTGPLLPTGLAFDGEVEDYAIRIVGVTGGFGGNADSYSVTEDSSLPAVAGRNVLANDNARDNSVNQVFSADTGVRTLAGGTLTLNANGTFQYTPSANFFGTEIFTYRIVDKTLFDQTGDLLVSTPTSVTITVLPANDAPRRVNDPAGANAPYPTQITVPKNSTTVMTLSQVLTNFNSDPSDDIVPGPVGVPAPLNESDQTLRLSVVGSSTTSQGGTVQVLSDGSLSYLPRTNFFSSSTNPPTFDTFRLRVLDNGIPQQFTEILVSVFVVASNDAPVVEDRSYDATEDITLTVAVANGLLLNASDPDGNAADLRVTGIDTTSLSTIGSVQLSGDRGAFSYVPRADFNGVDRFRFTVRDAGGALTTRIATINVGAVPDSPRITNPLGTLNLTEGGLPGFRDLTQFFSDPDGDALTFTVTSVTPAGRVTTRINGSLLEVTPAPDQFGQGTLVVITATDGDPRTSDIAQTLTVNVAEVYQPPRLIGGGIPDQNVNEDSTITPLALSNFFRSRATLQYRVVSNSNPGLVTVNINNGTMALVLAQDANGVAAIIIEATDGIQAISDQFQVVVASVPDAPRTNADSYTVPRGGILDVVDPLQGIIGNDIDPDGDTFEIVAVRINGQERTLLEAPFNLTRGVLEQVGASGTFRYVNNSGALNETDSFQYVSQDSTGRRAVGTVTLNLGPGPTTHHNPLVIGGNAGRDVNADGKLSPIDALLVINLLNRNGGTANIPVRQLPAPPAFHDVDANGFANTIDALLVINQLNRQGAAEPTLVDPYVVVNSAVTANSLVGGSMLPQAVSFATRSAGTIPDTGQGLSGGEERDEEFAWIDFADEESEKEEVAAAVDAVFGTL